MIFFCLLSWNIVDDLCIQDRAPSPKILPLDLLSPLKSNRPKLDSSSLLFDASLFTSFIGMRLSAPCALSTDIVRVLFWVPSVLFPCPCLILDPQALKTELEERSSNVKTHVICPSVVATPLVKTVCATPHHKFRSLLLQPDLSSFNLFIIQNQNIFNSPRCATTR